MIATNMKPADELLQIRDRIKELQEREAEIREGMISGAMDPEGDFAFARLAARKTSRFDRKAAEKELGSLSRFQVQGETVAVIVERRATR